MILQCGKAESGQAGALFGGGRRFGQLESRPLVREQLCLGFGRRLQLGAAFEPRSAKQSGPQIQNDSFNKYDFSFYIWIKEGDDGLTLNRY